MLDTAVARGDRPMPCERSVLITGCSSGIGLDAARTLRARGWRVLATCRKPEDCARLAAEGLESFPLDLADEAALAEAAAEALDRTGGRLDALVNNGAFAIPGAVEDLPRAALREIFETNLFGQVDLTNRLLPAMRRAGAGRVVMISSVLGLVAAPWRGAYVATKFALEGITDSAAAGARRQRHRGGADRARADRDAVPAQLDPALRAARRLAGVAAPRRLRADAAAAPLRPGGEGPLRASALGGHRPAGAGAGEPAAAAALLRDRADPRGGPAAPAPLHAHARRDRARTVRRQAPVTRQMTSPTSSATRSEPSGPMVTPTGRP